MYNIYKKILLVIIVLVVDASLYSMLPQLRLSRIRVPQRGNARPKPRLYTTPTQLSTPEIKPTSETKGFFAY